MLEPGFYKLPKWKKIKNKYWGLGPKSWSLFLLKIDFLDY